MKNAKQLSLFIAKNRFRVIKIKLFRLNWFFCVMNIYFLMLSILHFILFNLRIHSLMFNCVRNMNIYRDIYQIFIHGVKNAIWNTIFVRTLISRTIISRYENHDDCAYNNFVIFITFSYVTLTKKSKMKCNT